MTQRYIVHNVKLRQYFKWRTTGMTPQRALAYRFTAQELREAWSKLDPVKAKANLRIIPVRSV